MTAEERQHRIDEYLQKVEFASLEELSKQAGVSMSTIRRDLNIMEEGGGVRRTHGGARLLANPKSDEFAFSARDTHELEEKELIGRKCAEMIRLGQTVIIDAGTTAYHVARHLQDKNLQIVTNSLPVANLFTSAQRTEVIVTGGVIYPRLGVLVGPSAVKSFTEIHADVAVMGAGGITTDGLTNSHALLIDIQRAMMKSASQVIFCLDHTKFGRKSVAFLCDLDSKPTVITDGGASSELVNTLRHKGLNIVVVPMDGVADVSAPTEVTASAGLRQAESKEEAPTSAVAEGEATVSLVGWD
jgi:DeoR family transcriptional regulator, fructose operon transcriptional repressor